MLTLYKTRSIVYWHSITTHFRFLGVKAIIFSEDVHNHRSYSVWLKYLLGVTNITLRIQRDTLTP
jgi:hypothetical protein